MSRAIRSTLAVLTLWVVAAGGAVHALPLAPRPEAPRLFETLREWVAARFPSVLTSPREKAGGDMDPNGSPRLQPLAPGATTEAGGDMDPDG